MEKIIDVAESLRKDKKKGKKERERKRVTQQAMQYFLPSKTSTGLKRTSHGIWTPPNISFLPIIRMQQSRSRRRPRSAAFRPCPQAFRRQQPFETRKRAIFHGLGEHGPRAACKYSRARARTPLRPGGLIGTRTEKRLWTGPPVRNRRGAVKS